MLLKISNMSTAIHDPKSRITPMDVVQSTTPELSSETSNIGKDLTNPCQNKQEQKLASRPQVLPITTQISVYTTLSSIFYLFDMKFYRYLTPSNKKARVNLLQSEVIDNDSWIFAIQPPATIGGKRAFTVVRGAKLYDFIAKYLTQIPENDRHFYEVIRPLPQKPHFDIDGDLNNFNNYDDMVQSTDTALQLLLSSIEQVLREYNVNYTAPIDLSVFSSNGPAKRSYHVIIENNYHSDNKEAEAFYHLVISHMKAVGYNNRVIIDPKVYNSNQQFRLLGSQKPGSDRPKVLCSVLSRKPRDPSIYSPVDEFCATMVCFTSGCKLLPSFLNQEAVHSKVISHSIADVDHNSLINLVSGYRDYPNFTPRDSSKDYIIAFIRINPSYCALHKRVHDGVGAFITVSANGYVYWNCLAGNPSKLSICIGRINRNIIKDEVKPVLALDPDYISDDDIEYIGDNDDNDTAFSCFTGINLEDIEGHPDMFSDATKVSAQKYKQQQLQHNKLLSLQQLQLNQRHIPTHPIVNDITPVNNHQRRIPAQAIINGVIPAINDQNIRDPPINNNIVLRINQYQDNGLPVNNQINRKLRIATETDFNTFLISVGCTDPSTHKMGDCYKYYYEYCRCNNIIPPSTHASVVPDKRDVISEDINDFLEPLRVSDDKAKVKCKELYPYFNSYCNNNRITNRYSERLFTDTIKSLPNFNLILYRNCQYIKCISLNKLNNINIPIQTLNVSSSFATNRLSNNVNHENNDKTINVTNLPLLKVTINNNNKDNNKITGVTTNNNNNNNIHTDISDNIHICPVTDGTVNIAALSLNYEMLAVGSGHTMSNNPEISINSDTVTSTRPSEVGDIDNYFNEEFIKRDNSTISMALVNESFERYCKINKLEQTIKNVKLFNMIADRNRVRIIYAGELRYLSGYKLKHDPRKMDDNKVVRGYRRIWQNWDDPYLIGWNNGPYPNPIQGPEWNNIDITYTHTLPLLSIEEMVKVETITEISPQNNSSMETEPARELIDINRLQTIIYTCLQAKEMRPDLNEDQMKELINGVMSNYQRTPGILATTTEVLPTTTNDVTTVMIPQANIPILDINVENYIRSYLREIDDSITEDVINGAIQHIATTVDENIIKLASEWNLIEQKYVLAIKAGCGAGKTNGIKPYIIKLDSIIDAMNTIRREVVDYYSRVTGNLELLLDKGHLLEPIKKLRIVVCVNRRTLSNKFYREYRRLGFKIHNGKSKEAILGDRVIVCYPSVWRVIGDFQDGICILDEYCSTIKLQFQVVKRKRACFKRLKSLMKCSGKVIIADAGLKNRHILDIQRISGRNVTMHQNTARVLEGKCIIPVWKKGILIKRTIESLREGKRVAVPTSSKKYARILKETIERELPGINIGIYTADETCEIEEDPVSLWSQHQCIIYTGTIQAGNSYTEMVDEVHGFFMTSTADYEDIMQMLLRCRNIGTGRIYVCLETRGGGKKIIPNDVRANISSIKEYLLDEDIMARGYLESDEFKLPIDLLETDQTGRLDQNGKYLNLYCGYIKDLVLQQRGTSFLLMLALRDQGARFGGYLGRMEYDDMTQQLEKDFMKKSKEANGNTRTQISRMKDLNDDEAKLLASKDKTATEVMELKKYRLKKEYGVEVTEQLIKKTQGLHTKHNNLVKFARVSGIEDETQRQQIMGDIGNNMMKTKDDVDDIVNRIDKTTKLIRVKHCYHALNLLRLLGIGNFMDRLQAEAETVIEFNQGLKQILDRYIRQYAEDIRHILKLDQDELDTEDIDVLSIIGELIYGAFGIKVITIKNHRNGKLELPISQVETPRLQIKSTWMKHGDLIIPRGILSG